MNHQFFCRNRHRLTDVVRRRSASDIRYRCPAFVAADLLRTRKSRRPLRNEEDFPGIRIFYFRARREAFYINVFSRRKWAFHQILLTWNRDAIRKITLRYLGRCGCRSRPYRRLFGRVLRLSGAIGIERLLLGRILLLRFLWISRNLMPNSRRRLIRFTSRKEEKTQQRKGKREFHNGRLTKVASFSFVANR